MNYVERAIIVAAGIGKRMQPISLETPKPLVRVNGERMIESVIKALRKNGIYEIYVVVGYLKEQFKPLEAEYPGLKLIDNPYYDKCNNIASLYAARDKIENCIILDGDQIISNVEILRKPFVRSGYNAIWTEGESNEWMLELEGDKIISCSRNGGKNAWRLFSVSRWTKEDGQRLKKHLEIEFEQNKNYQIYWDDVALFCYPDEYELGIMPMNESDIVEIDNIEELAQIDSSYKKYLEANHAKQ